MRVLSLSEDSPGRLLHATVPIGAEGTIDFSASSSMMAVRGNCGVQLWDTRTWRSVTLTRKGARSVMFPRDGAGEGEGEGGGTVVALIGGELRRWDLRAAWESDTENPASEVVWRGWGESWASLHPDGTSVVVSDRDYILRVDLESRAVTPIMPALPRTERPIVDATGRWLFVGNWRGAPAQVADLHAGVTALRLSESSVRGAFSLDGGILTVGLPGRHLVFDPGRWDSPREFRSREPGLSTVAGASTVAPGGALLAYVEPPHVVRLGDPRTGEILATLPNAERYGIPDIRFSPDGRLLVVLTLEETVIIWRMDELRDGLEKLQMGW